MGENLNIFGKNQEEIGSLDKNLVLRTQGRVYIRYGKKYIELLDSQGNINVKIPKVIQKIKSESEMKGDGFYLLDGNLYAYSGGQIIQLSGVEGSFISYAIEQNLTQEQIDIAQKNIGLKYPTIKDAMESVEKGIVFVGDNIYYIDNGTSRILINSGGEDSSLNSPLAEINNANLGSYPPYEKTCIAFVDGYWVYSEFSTQDDLDNLKEEILNEVSTLQGSSSSFDTLEYSKVYSIRNGNFSSSGITDLVTSPTFNQSNNDILVLTLNVVKITGTPDSATEGTESIIGLVSPFDEETQVFQNEFYKTFTLKVSGNDLVFDPSFTINEGYVFNSRSEYLKDNVPDFYLISEGLKVDYAQVDGEYILFPNGFSGNIKNKNLFLKSTAASKLETFKIDYNNSEIALEENQGSSTNNKHTVIGNVHSYNTYSDKGNQGIYSDNAIFVGGEFKKGEDDYKDFPRYSVDLNNTLCTNHSTVSDGNNFDNVIPTIKWVKRSTALVEPLFSINNQNMGAPSNSDECITWDGEKWIYKVMITKEYFDDTAVVDATYDSNAKFIYFKNVEGDNVASINAADFIKDGMVNDVKIQNNNLVISFNTDAGKQPISIPLTDIFNPSNYYTKTEINTALAKKVNISDYNTKIEEIETAISEKADESAIIDMATKTWVNEQGFLKEQSLSAYSTTEEMNIAINNAVENKADKNNTYTKTEVDNNISTATIDMATKTWVGDQHYLTQHQSLANYYTKSETNTAISNATNDMATKTWVNNQGFLKQHQSLTNYYTKTEVDDKITQAVSDTMPIGSIIMFGKPQNQIPSGWHICDGTSGTPDLRGRFIVGASGESSTDYNRGTTGGIQKNIINSSDIPIPSHKHSFEDFYVFETWDPLAEARDEGKLAGYSTLSGSKGGLTRISSISTYYGNYQSDKNNDTFAWYLHNTRDTLTDYGEKIDSIENQLELDNRPPYYALYYIMKIS